MDARQVNTCTLLHVRCMRTPGTISNRFGSALNMDAWIPYARIRGANSSLSDTFRSSMSFRTNQFKRFIQLLLFYLRQRRWRRHRQHTTEWRRIEKSKTTKRNRNNTKKTCRRRRDSENRLRAAWWKCEMSLILFFFIVCCIVFYVNFFSLFC